MSTNIPNNLLYLFLLFASVNIACNEHAKGRNNPKESDFAYELGVVAGFSELVNAGVKRLALSSPMTPGDMDKFIIEAIPVAEKHNVAIFRESDLIITDLFPADVAAGKEVLLLFQGTTKEEYITLKKDQKRLEETGALDATAQRNISRRFGRLLSYTPKKINQLLSQNSSFRTLDDFGIRASNLFLYYKDLKKASSFYQDILGLELLASYDNADILQIAEESYVILVDAAKGMHTADEPKTVALALLTNQLDEWYEYIKEQNVKIKYDYKPKDGGPHDGFVIHDPEGYLLEFERFKQHEENERFVPLLKTNRTFKASTSKGHSRPDNLGFHSSITWLYYKDLLSIQGFYEDVLGLELVADQGWTKIYQVSKTGFIGLVDERRGMHSFTEKKAVSVSFVIDQLDDWFTYVQKHSPFELRKEEIGVGPDKKYRAFVGYDPEGYFLEFDTFYDHEDNTLLMNALNRK